MSLIMGFFDYSFALGFDMLLLLECGPLLDA